MTSRVRWTSGQEFTLDGVGYCALRPPGDDTPNPGPDPMRVFKPREAIERYEALINAEHPRFIVELGIHAGGSTALLAQLAVPEKLVAIDLRDAPVAKLEAFIDAKDLRGHVRACYGVDQADVARLDEIVQSEFDGNLLDLVIDDASHLLGQTRESFNCLFPRLRPGGSYVIEDWSWPHRSIVVPNPLYQDVTPLSALVLELALVAAGAPRVIADVTLAQGWALVHRGAAPLPLTAFDISEYVDEVGQAMVAALASTRTLS